MPNKSTKPPKKKRKLTQAQYAEIGAALADWFYKRISREPEPVRTFRDLYRKTGEIPGVKNN